MAGRVLSKGLIIFEQSLIIRFFFSLFFFSSSSSSSFPLESFLPLPSVLYSFAFSSGAFHVRRRSVEASEVVVVVELLLREGGTLVMILGEIHTSRTRFNRRRSLAGGVPSLFRSVSKGFDSFDEILS